MAKQEEIVKELVHSLSSEVLVTVGNLIQTRDPEKLVEEVEKFEERMKLLISSMYFVVKRLKGEMHSSLPVEVERVFFKSSLDPKEKLAKTEY